MVGLSQTTQYAIQTLRCLASGRCPTRSLADVAACSSIPRPYLAKIVNTLARSGMVLTKRGVGGGITLARSADEITLLEVVRVFEGPTWITHSLIDLGNAEKTRRCPTQAAWARIRNDIESELQHTTLADVLAPQREYATRTSPSPCGCATHSCSS